MPLPDASDVEKARIYRQFQSKNALAGDSNGLTDQLMDALRLQTFVDTNNEDELRRVALVGASTRTMSFSGPIPGSAQIYIATIDDNSQQTIFQPGIGEVWQLVGISFTRTAGTGSSTYTMYLNDGSNDVYWFYASSSDTATAFSADSNFPDFPMYFDRGLYLSGGVSNGSGGGGIAGSWKVAVIRVR
tara:strand:+ start:1070 stop:1633 length:564 start_codon:yes stop_codon:yes gene_type:complete